MHRNELFRLTVDLAASLVELKMRYNTVSTYLPASEFNSGIVEPSDKEADVGWITVNLAKTWNLCKTYQLCALNPETGGVDHSLRGP